MAIFLGGPRVTCALAEPGGNVSERVRDGEDVDVTRAESNGFYIVRYEIHDILPFRLMRTEVSPMS